MKNIFLLPTDQSSRLFLEYGDGDLCLSNQFLPQTARSNNQNMYITSDEPIKKDDWYYNERLNQIFQAVIDSGYNTTDKEFKIILTTNQDLIADGVQDIDDEFLEWFVENPGCEYAEVKKGFEDGTNYGFNFIDYKITIPQEEPKQETTYSEEEVLELLHNYRNNFELYRNIQVLPNDFFGWFEKFKKK